MTTNTTDQQLTLPTDPDTADNPVAFTNFVAGVEQRLVRRYTTEADRTARMLVLNENDLSTLATENRVDCYDGTNHISLAQRALFAAPFRTADAAAIVSNTVLQSDAVLTVALPTAGRFQFDLTLYYDSSTTADLKVAFAWPALATARWGMHGPATTVAAGVGDGVFNTVASSGTSIVIGGSGNGAASIMMAIARGSILMGGTAGNLVVQYAQNVSDATNTIVRADSRLQVWRVA